MSEIASLICRKREAHIHMIVPTATLSQEGRDSKPSGHHDQEMTGAMPRGRTKNSCSEELQRFREPLYLHWDKGYYAPRSENER
jgi:hypothetical protein